MSLELKVKRLRPDAKLPTKAHASDAGFDLYSAAEVDLMPGQTIKVETGIAVGLPTGYFAKFFDRSSVGSKGVIVTAGVIDEGYTGPLIIAFYNSTNVIRKVAAGEKIAQMVLLPVPQATIIEVEELGQTERAEKGFGSSGNS